MLLYPPSYGATFYNFFAINYQSMSRLQNYLGTGITDSAAPSAPWLAPYTTYPHPYFGHNILVLIGLQTAFRCKIVKTKELPVKLSRIRS